MICPNCGSNAVTVQPYQEQKGSKTVTKTKSKYKEKGHGCLWWLFIGWWWWIVDLFLWIFAFPIRLITALFRKKKYVGKSKAVSVTKNKVSYTTLCVCQDCGHVWKGSAIR